MSTSRRAGSDSTLTSWGRPGLLPGRYFRLLLLGYFEGLDSERGIAWRAGDSLSVRSVLGLALHEAPPDHSTVSRTRRLIDLETHQAVLHVGVTAPRGGEPRQWDDDRDRRADAGGQRGAAQHRAA